MLLITSVDNGPGDRNVHLLSSRIRSKIYDVFCEFFYVIAITLRILNIKTEIIPHLSNNYGKDEVEYYRKSLEEANKRLEKSKFYLEFLMKCKTYKTVILYVSE